jgi:hypothetical protein
VIKNTRDESTFPAIAKMVSPFGSYIEKEAKQYNFRTVNTDFDFERKLRESLDSLSL